MRSWTDFAKISSPGWLEFKKDSEIIQQFDTPEDKLICSKDKIYQDRLERWRLEQ